MLTNLILGVILQFLDGFLTYLVVTGWGLEIEGNRLIRSLMVNFGVGNALFFAKFMSCLGCWFLFNNNYKKCLIGINGIIVLIVLLNIYVLYNLNMAP